MANQELIDYINRQRVHGASAANIKNALLHAGWEEGDVDKGLKATEKIADHPPLPPDVIIRPEGSSSPVEGVPAITAHTKRVPILAIISLIAGIVLVGGAAVFVYVKFLRPQPSRKVDSVAVVENTKATTSVQVDTSVSSSTLPTPVNSEGGKVQDAPVTPPVASSTPVSDTQALNTVMGETAKFFALNERLYSGKLILAQSPSKYTLYQKGKPLTLGVTLDIAPNEKLQAASLIYTWDKDDAKFGVNKSSYSIPAMSLSNIGHYKLDISMDGAVGSAKADWYLYVAPSVTPNADTARKQLVTALKAKNAEKVISFFGKEQQTGIASLLLSGTTEQLSSFAAQLETATVGASTADSVEYVATNVGSLPATTYRFQLVDGSWVLG